MRIVASSLVCLLCIVTGVHRVEAQAAAQGEQGSAPAFTFAGETALWTVAIRPDKVADFERVLGRLRSALQASQKPQRREQAAGWSVIKIDKPMPDGNIAYVHVIKPVVAGADYSVMQILYDEFPEERQELYEAYRAAFAQNLALSTGNLAVDMSAHP
jgi:hypothetical protein